MDVLIISYPKGLKLLKIFCESYAYHYKGSGYLYIVIEKESISEVKSFVLPARVKIIPKEDILPNHTEYNGYLTQQFFKLTAYNFVDSKFYLTLDDDFVFLRPTYDEHFIVQGKPLWFLTSWERAGVVGHLRVVTKDYIGMDPAYCTLSPINILHREVLESLERAVNLRKVLDTNAIHEFQVYGAYAYKNFKHLYLWINSFWGYEGISFAVNQPPPSYLVLDPSVTYDQFSHFNLLEFWSHWSCCEEKMRVFFELSK